MTENAAKMMSIWFMVGMILVLYGLLITGCGIYYAIHPEAVSTQLAELNPSLWWGASMFGLGAVFMIFGR